MPAPAGSFVPARRRLTRRSRVLWGDEVGWYTDRVLPRIVDVALGKNVESTRAQVAKALSGTVLELGFGSGRNLPHYPVQVTDVLAVEPADTARALAADRINRSGVRVQFIGGDGAQLDLDSQTVDHALVTWTLCTIPDVGAALAETHRVLKPGGCLHFVEHGRSPRPGVALWQTRLNPIWGRLFGGCHLDRPVTDLIDAAGFRLTALTTHTERPGELIGLMYQGVAIKQ